jgi:hypothetical protein
MTATSLTPQQKEIFETFRKQVFEEDIIHDGDSIGTDDATLL